jgi:hypothetical protein
MEIRRVAGQSAPKKSVVIQGANTVREMPQA